MLFQSDHKLSHKKQNNETIQKDLYRHPAVRFSLSYSGDLCFNVYIVTETGMKKESDTKTPSNPVSSERRNLLKAAGAGVLAATFSNVAFAGSDQTGEKSVRTLRWGVVGTGELV